VSELASLSLERIGGIAFARMSGEVDYSNAEDLRDRIARWVTNEDPVLVLDCTELSYTDSAGLNLIFDLWARLREHGQAFGIVVPAGSQPRRTFAIVGLEEQVPVFETVAEAQAWFTGPTTDSRWKGTRLGSDPG
jgi:anti-sigma B factor antagonist